MNYKNYFKAVGLAAGVSLALTLLLAMLAVASWILVWAVLLIVLLPIAQKAVKFYTDTCCDSLEDFVEELLDLIRPQKEESTIDLGSDW